MAQANERKSVLRHLWANRIVPAVLPSEKTAGPEDASATGDSRGAGDGERSTGLRDGGATERPILTPEERILELVAEHGGRMRQGEVVSKIEWSESTVSRKLQSLESTGDVTRCRLGREKLVYLPGREPAALDSPFDREEGDAPLAD